MPFRCGQCVEGRKIVLRRCLRHVADGFGASAIAIDLCRLRSWHRSPKLCKLRQLDLMPIGFVVYVETTVLDETSDKCCRIFRVPKIRSVAIHHFRCRWRSKILNEIFSPKNIRLAHYTAFAHPNMLILLGIESLARLHFQAQDFGEECVLVVVHEARDAIWRSVRHEPNMRRIFRVASGWLTGYSKSPLRPAVDCR